MLVCNEYPISTYDNIISTYDDLISIDKIKISDYDDAFNPNIMNLATWPLTLLTQCKSTLINIRKMILSSLNGRQLSISHFFIKLSNNKLWSSV